MVILAWAIFRSCLNMRTCDLTCLRGCEIFNTSIIAVDAFFKNRLLGSWNFASQFHLVRCRTVEAHIKVSRFSLCSLDRLFSNWLVFLIPACKILSKVLKCQSFSNSVVYPHRGTVRCQGRHMTPTNRL